MTRRTVAWGAVVVAVYAAVALLLPSALPLRPVFDGLAPQLPYKWVSPPPDFVTGNVPPAGATQKLGLPHNGTAEVSVATPDGQATLILPEGAFPPNKLDKDVRIDVTPRNAARYGPPPSGLAYAGNAYDIRATYEPSGKRADPVLDATVLLGYATTATQIVLRTGSTWTTISTTDVPASLQVFAKTKKLGVIVPVGHRTSTSLRWWTLGIASGIAALLGGAFGLRERRRIGRTGG